MRHFFIVFHQALPVHKTHHNSPWLFLIQRSLRHLLSEILTAIPIYHIFISFALCMNYISKWFFQDFDNDGWLDLFVIGDFGQSKMFWNKKDGTFTECTVACGINGTQVSVGTGRVEGKSPLTSIGSIICQQILSYLVVYQKKVFLHF